MEKAFQHKERRLGLSERMLKRIIEEMEGMSNGGDKSIDKRRSARAFVKSSVVMLLMKVVTFEKRECRDVDSIDEIYILFLIYK